MQRLYAIRSTIVHGGSVGAKDHQWLNENQRDIEYLIRSALAIGVEKIPADDVERRTFLTELFDVSSDDRVKKLVQEFKQIKDKQKQLECTEELMKIAKDPPT